MRSCGLLLALSLTWLGGLQAQDMSALAALKTIPLEAPGSLTVRELFDVIEGQSSLTFSYHENDLGSVLGRSIRLDEPLTNAYEALQRVAKAEGLTFKRLGNTVNVLKAPLPASGAMEGEKKTYLVRGTVLGEQGQGLPRATILLKDAPGVGAMSGLDGQFSLEVPEGPHRLIVRFIGYLSQEVAVSPESSPLRIEMEPNVKALEEVVVVGYGQQKKESITGAIATIGTQEITQTKTANVANNLVGRIPGLVINARGGEPGQESMEIFIRGKATTGDASPLFVIDGVANRGSFERLNPKTSKASPSSRMPPPPSMAHRQPMA
jgi:TonB-dependent starch-binding outer membrane protein SusC